MTSLAVEITGAIGVHFVKINMNLGMNIFDLINLPLATMFYNKRFHWKKKNAISTIIIVVFLLFALINLVFVQGPFNFNGYTTSFASVWFIVISLAYFYVLIQQLPTESITKLPMFWINTAILIYNSATFVFFLAADYLIRVLNNNLIGYWMFRHSFGLIYLGMMLYALLLIRREYQTKQTVASLN